MRVIIELDQDEQAGTAIQVVPAASSVVTQASTPAAGPNGHAADIEIPGRPAGVSDDEEEATDAGPPPAALLRSVAEGISLLATSGSNGAAY